MLLKEVPRYLNGGDRRNSGQHKGKNSLWHGFMPIVLLVPTRIFLIGRHGVKPPNALYHCMKKGLQLAPFLLINCVWPSYRIQAQT